MPKPLIAPGTDSGGEDVSRDEGDNKVIVRHLSEEKKDVEAEDYHLS